MAFLVALHQNRALIGSDGLLPVDNLFQTLRKRAGTDWLARLQIAPTLLWWTDQTPFTIDDLLDYLSYAGLALAGTLVVFGSSNVIIMLLLWILYHSIVNVGQRW